MKKSGVLFLTRTSVIAALYVALTLMQQLLLPGSASFTVQFRASEFMMLLCVFMPEGISGLTLGCLLSNLMTASVLPTDLVFGTLATLSAGLTMYALRRVRIKGLPLLSAVMPAVFNGLIIGWQLEVFYIQGKFTVAGFLLQAGSVALGELAVCLILGLPFAAVFEKRIGKALR